MEHSNKKIKNLFLGIKQYQPCITLKEKNRLIKSIDNLPYSNLHKPSYQKNIFSKNYEKIIYNKVNSKLFKAFEEACCNYLNHKPRNINIKSWVHVTWNNANKKPNVGHRHNRSNEFALSGILYLHLPKKSETTFFYCEDKKFSLPRKELSWFIFKSDAYHEPGRCFEKDKRYCISADFWLANKDTIFG